MLDPIKMMSKLSHPQEIITPDMFSRWKHDPCTKELHKELIAVFLEEITQSLPESTELSLVTVWKREGAIEMINQLFDWEPANIRSLRSSGKEVAIDD